MNKCVKIRIGAAKELIEFPDRNAAFGWVRENKSTGRNGRCVISVLTFENGAIEDLTRWHFNGQYFKKEDITS